MTLLEAINRILVSTGESEITVVDGTHPLQAVAISTIDKVSNRKQARGWWFNSRVLTLEPSVDVGPTLNKLVVDPKYTYVRPVQRELPYIAQGGFIFDTETNEDVEGFSLEVEAIERITFTSLPETFADWVATAAALSFATTYDADPLKLQTLNAELASANAALNMEHTRMSRTNLFYSGSVGVALARIRGFRYGVRP